MLNEKARMIYDFIQRCIDSGYSPTMREVCAELGIKSTSTVHRYVSLLVEEGLLDKMDNQNRAIRLHTQIGQRVPLVGTVTAGQPITAIESIEGYLPYVPKHRHSRPLFALHVRGESMINAGILDGDIAIVEQCETAGNGEIVVVLVDGEDATVKRFYKENGGYRLQPENDSMEPIYATDVRILGKVVALMRYLD